MGSYSRGRYHKGSIRYHGYDYTQPGRYFITICTKNRKRHFGLIEHEKMILSEKGKIAQQILIDIPLHFPFMRLDEYVIMPDHVHAIIIINGTVNPAHTIVDPSHVNADPSHANVDSLHANVDSLHATNLHGETKNMYMSAISPSAGSLASIIRSYKSAVSKAIHVIDRDFEWQRIYYDNIIRSDIRFSRIREYIRNNPKKWNKQQKCAD